MNYSQLLLVKIFKLLIHLPQGLQFFVPCNKVDKIFTKQIININKQQQKVKLKHTI